MKQQKKFSDHAMPARRPRKTQGKCVLFADAAKLYIEYSKAVTSAETAVKRMRFFAQFYNAAFAERDIASISPSDVYRWFDGVITAKRRDGKGCYAPRTLRSIWGQLYTFFSWCSTRYPVQNPMYAIKMPRTRAAERNMTFWEISEFRKFISHVDDVTWRAFFTFQYYTGCRIGETLALQEKDYSGGAVRIDKSLSKQTLTDAHFEIKSTKTGKRRTVPLPRSLQKTLNDYILWKRDRGLPAEFLFCGRDGGHLPHSTIRRRFDVYTEAAGVPRIKIHDLRHSYVSLLIHKGANLAVIASLIGDSFEQVTNTYGHMYESDKINAVRLLDTD